MPIQMTIPTAKVVAALLADPGGEHYGLRLMRQTDLASGTLYPILARLQKVGWLTARWEDEDPSDAGRPVRRYYQLTAQGAEQARAALAELHASTAVDGTPKHAARGTTRATARPAW